MKTQQIDVYRSFSQPLQDIWYELESEGSCYVFQTFNWLRHWYSTVGTSSNVEPVIIVVMHDNIPVALFPFLLQTRYRIRIIKFMGGDQCDYNSPLIRYDMLLQEQLAILWRNVLVELPQHDALNLVRIPECINGSKNPLLMNGKSYNFDGFSCSSLLHPTWNEHKLSLSKRLIKDNARMWRRLSELGDVHVVHVSSLELYQKTISTTISQKSQRYLETGARNIFVDESVRAFYLGLYAVSSETLKIHLTALKLGETVLATHLGVYDKNRYYYLMPTFAGSELSKYSPGRLLLEYLVEGAIDRGLKFFDFTVGSEGYKSKWCNSEMKLYRIVNAHSFRGYIYVIGQSIINSVKRNRHTRQFLMKSLRIVKSTRNKLL